MLYITGPILCRLMRRHHVTIRTLAQRLGVPMCRVRLRRRHGIDDRHVARDWLEAITGQDPGMLYGPVSDMMWLPARASLANRTWLEGDPQAGLAKVIPTTSQTEGDPLRYR